MGNNNRRTDSKITSKGESDEEDTEPPETEKDESENKTVSDADSLKTKKAVKEKKPKPLKDLFTVKVSNLSFKCKKRDLKSFFSPHKSSSLRLPPNIKGIAFVGFLTEKEQKIALNNYKRQELCWRASGSGCDSQGVEISRGPGVKVVQAGGGPGRSGDC